MVEDVLVLKVKIRLNSKWAKNYPDPDAIEYIKGRMNSSLGFRGDIEDIKVLKR